MARAGLYPQRRGHHFRRGRRCSNAGLGVASCAVFGAATGARFDPGTCAVLDVATGVATGAATGADTSASSTGTNSRNM